MYNELCNLEPQVLQKWLLKFCCMLHDDMADARYHSKKSLIGRAKRICARQLSAGRFRGLTISVKNWACQILIFQACSKKKQGILLSDT